VPLDKNVSPFCSSEFIHRGKSYSFGSAREREEKERKRETRDRERKRKREDFVMQYAFNSET
jgi:hypothetical protein